MGDLVLRDVDERVMQSLQRRAARAGRSVEEEHRAILEDATGQETSDPANPEFRILEARRLRALSPRMPDDSTDVVRALRDGRSFD